MNIDDLTRTARDAAWNSPTDDNVRPNWRAAVLAVLADVRKMVPEPLILDGTDDYTLAVEAGHNDACAEMLRRLDAMGAPK